MSSRLIFRLIRRVSEPLPVGAFGELGRERRLDLENKNPDLMLVIIKLF